MKMNSKQWFLYWTTIVYFNSKNDNNKLRNTFDQQANIEHLGDIPDAKFNIIKMTGDEDFTEIKDSLNDIQREKNKMKTHNLILATSTISHGVDEDEFNNIFFMVCQVILRNIFKHIQE